MTVDELISHLESYRGDMPVVIEAARIGKDDRSEIHDVQKALYDREEIHIIAANGVRDR